MLKMMIWNIVSVIHRVIIAVIPAVFVLVCLDLTQHLFGHLTFFCRDSAILSVCIISVAAWVRILLTFFISGVCWLLANIMSKSFCSFQKYNRNTGCRCCITVYLKLWVFYCLLVCTHCWELMNSVRSHGNLSLLFSMVMVWDFVSDNRVMTHSCHVRYGFAGTNWMVTVTSLLWSFIAISLLW
jgi:hypothetical protein